MWRRKLILFFMLAMTMALGAQARDQGPSRSESHASESRASDSSRQGGQDNAARGRSDMDSSTVTMVEEANRQKRRDVLREALRGQAEEAPATMRQMSLQERMELRQQLRQQQEWLK
jgi:hypothetical protein